MKNQIEKTVDILHDITNEKVFERERLCDIIRNTEDINICDEKWGDTILSLLIKYIYSDINETDISDVIRCFLENGYDVTANGGINGKKVLDALAFSHVDENTLKGIKLLFDAGAPLVVEKDYADVDDDFSDEGLPEGVEGSVDVNAAGAWGPEHSYNRANILEAYLVAIKAYKDGKDYSGIESYDKSIRKNLLGVSYTGTAYDTATINNITEYTGKLIFDFEGVPLAVDNYLNMVVNPLELIENEITDTSHLFKEIIGARLEKIRYIDSIFALMDFDNGYRLLISTCDAGDNRRHGLFEIRKIEHPKIKELDVDAIYMINGHSYAPFVKIYEEPMIVLHCYENAYCIFPEYHDEYINGIGIIACSKELLKDYSKKLPPTGIKKLNCFTNSNFTTALSVECNEGFFYI
ncbi:MAG: hypothetical protein IJN39_03800, partial [Clostridia bacterium]|nr:hypothetical protein [Clostridia bacterium]